MYSPMIVTHKIGTHNNIIKSLIDNSLELCQLHKFLIFFFVITTSGRHWFRVI